jgi:hypothetical protein
MRDVCERAKKEKHILKRDELFPGESSGAVDPQPSEY